jgi:hypothetical protein
MAETKDVLAEIIGRYLTGFALSKAILEDYARVIAKLENVPELEVKDRVWKRCNEIFEEVKEKQRKQSEEVLNKS